MTSPCELVQIEYQGNGSQVIFPFPFPYDFKTEVKVALWNNVQKKHIDIATNDPTYPWEVSDANPTAVTFTSTAPPAPPSPGVNEDPIFNVRIYRITDLTEIRAVFNQGSAIRASDLNKNFEQLRFAIQEGKCQVSDKVFAYLQEYYWNKFDQTSYSAASGGTWVSNDQTIATTAAIDQRFQDELTETIESTEAWISDDSRVATTAALDARFVDQLNNETIAGVKTFSSSPIIPTTPSGSTAATNKTYVDTEINDKIDAAITGDIGTDGTGITVTNDGDGTITLGLASGTIDLDRIKAEDIVTTAEQNSGSPVWTNDDTRIATIGALARRHDNFVQANTPLDTNYAVGKFWFQEDQNKTLSVWNGSGWIGIASGGTFTSQPTVIYVDAANGNDTNDGHRIISPKKTIKNAVASAVAGDIIVVAPGVYRETLPIDITVDNLSIVGQSIRSCFIHPTAATETQTMFRCNSGTYITGFTFAGLKASGARGGHPVDNDATYGLPANQGWVAGFYPGATIRKSPYIQNCTNFADSAIDNNNFNPNNFPGTGGDLTSAPTGGGIFVDGSVPSVDSPLRSFVVDSFTQVCLDGPGCLVANNGYAQLVSFFGTFCHYHTKALSGGQVNLTNSTTDFGRYGLIADGKSTSPIFTATANGSANAGAITFAINQPVDLWFGSATRPLDNMLVQIGSDIYEILSSTPNGTGWNVTISRPNPANRAENLGLINGHANNAAISFYLQSFVSTSGHTFEYTGSGTNYTALPQNGGNAIESNQSISRNRGRVWLSSTDQNGKFKVGDTFQVDQRTGFVTVDPQSYATNLVSDLTPELGGDLDVLNRRVYTSLANTDINIDANGSGLLKVAEYNLGRKPIVTQADIGNDPNQISLNSMLGDLAFQNAAGVNLGTVSVDLGTAAAPTIDFNGDPDTGIYSPGANQFAVSTGGSERLRVDASGRVGIGANAPLSELVVGPNTATMRVGSDLTFYGALSHDFSNANVTLGQYGTFGAAALRFLTQGSEKMRIDSSGKLLIGTSSDFDGYLNQVSSTSGALLSLRRTNSNPGSIKLSSGASGDNVGNNGQLGYLRWYGFHTSADYEAARIAAEVDGVAGANDMPGRLLFLTTADGSSSPTERMRIDSSGRVLVGTSSDTSDAQAVFQGYASGTGESIVAFRSDENPPTGTIAQLRFEGGNAGRAAQINAEQEETWTSGSSHPGRLVFSTTANGSVNPTERMRIDSSGRVLVGTSSVPTTGNGQYAPLVLQGSIGASTNETYLSLQRGQAATSFSAGSPLGSVVFADNAGRTFAQITGAADGAAGLTDLPGRISLYTCEDNSTSLVERFRTSSSGQAGTFTSAGSSCLYFTSAEGAGSTYTLIQGRYGGTGIYTGTTSFNVFTNGNVQNTNNSYGAISDIKLKENIVDANSQWDDLKALQVRNYNFKEGQTHTQIGLIAQEVELISPGLVSESPDRDEDGNDLGTVTKSVNYSVLYMKAVKALQEAMERIETLEAKVAALEGN